MKTTGMSPIFAFAIGLAYVARADKETGLEEKAQIASIFNRHVRRKDLNDEDLRTLIQDAFEFAATVPMVVFLKNAPTLLTSAQKHSIVFNMFDLMLADGHIHENEKKVVFEFAKAFEIARGTMDGLREVLVTKNDTTVFTEPSHKRNNDRSVLRIEVFRE